MERERKRNIYLPITADEYTQTSKINKKIVPSLRRKNKIQKYKKKKNIPKTRAHA
jgi:phosphopantetheine adenylyltransferase